MRCSLSVEMKLPVAIVILCIGHGVHSQGFLDGLARVPGSLADGASHILGGLFGIGGKSTDPCDRDVSQEYTKAIDGFYNKLYTHVAAHSNNHFVFSPYTIWLSLSALAEGADPSVQSQLFTSLALPQESCIRNRYYDIALNVEQPGRDVTLARRRALVLDENLKVNPSWGKMMRSTGLLNIMYAPIKRDPKKTSRKLRRFIKTRSNIVVKGNSVLLDSLDYQGMWTTAFDDATVQRQPFFNDVGQQIGMVDMMSMKKKVRLAQVPFMSAKVLELPVGAQGRYTMLIVVGTDNNLIQNAINIFMGSILEIFSLLQMSLFPLEIAIPKFAINSEFNARSALEEIDIRGFWMDPAATAFVSTPAAAPGGLIQRVSVQVGSRGVEPPPTVGKDLLSGLVNLASDTATGVASAVGHEFRADRPFMFALFDTKTHTCLYAGAFSKPDAN